MTLIECFTDSHIDNIAACLRLQPDRMVMIGNAAKMSEPIKRYQKLFKRRGITTEITMCDMQKMDLDEIYAALKKLVLETKDCVIDLTGGDECVIMAVGAVLAELPIEVRQQVRIEKFDHDTNVVRDCVRDNRKIQTKSIDLTVTELIALHGGTLHPSANQLPEGSNHRDLAGLWEVVSENPKDWNRAIMLLGEFESRSDSKMQVFLPLAHLRNSISDFESKENTVRELLGKLHRRGIIDDQSNRNVLEYTYTSQLLRYCTLKAGNVLETKTLLEGRACLDNGVPYFHDCLMSVSIDWDGVVHDPIKRIPETRNEIDVVLMRGMTPLFISCKNGNVSEEELYKLNTVAERFGGPYAKKMLIATDLDRKGSSANRAFIQRAWDMDIFLVTDAAELTREEWRQVFKKAML